MIKYIIDDIPPSNNKFIGRTNKWEYQKIKKYWAEQIFWKCRPKPMPPIEKARVTLIYFFPTHTRRDPDNYSGKMLLDGLVKAQILTDDSFNYIELVLKADYDKANPRTEIIIEKV